MVKADPVAKSDGGNGGFLKHTMFVPDDSSQGSLVFNVSARHATNWLWYWPMYHCSGLWSLMFSYSGFHPLHC